MLLSLLLLLLFGSTMTTVKKGTTPIKMPTIVSQVSKNNITLA